MCCSGSKSGEKELSSAIGRLATTDTPAFAGVLAAAYLLVAFLAVVFFVAFGLSLF